jgi:hypothetical protein
MTPDELRLVGGFGLPVKKNVSRETMEKTKTAAKLDTLPLFI